MRIAAVCLFWLAIGIAMAAIADRRILFVGDSWTDMPQIFWLAWDEAMKARGLDPDEFGLQVGCTARSGSTAANWASDLPMLMTPLGEPISSVSGRELISLELQKYPTIDIVHLSMGGNDFNGVVGLASAVPVAQRDMVYDGIVDNIATVVEHILNVRPNMRVVICGYTFINATGKVTASVEEVNREMVKFSQKVRDYALQTPQCHYVNNLGLMQYYADTTGKAVFPGEEPDYNPMPGGNGSYEPVTDFLFDDFVHLNHEGYVLLLENCIDQYYFDWLVTPNVCEIQPLGFNPTSESLIRYHVLFNMPVSGVDVMDFKLERQGGQAAAHIEKVTGSGNEYEVYVRTGQANGSLGLSLHDNDSIVGKTGVPLGGEGDRNGSFEGPEVMVDQSIEIPAGCWSY